MFSITQRRLATAGMALCMATGAASGASGPRMVPSSAVRAFVSWAIADRAGTPDRPWAVLDKSGARLHVFDARGALLASSPVLLGAAVGDDSVPGIGDRRIADIRPEEKTTPAGRFATEPGRNLQDEDIVWVDYDAAISLHRVRPLAGERRLERLASATARDNRISYGCINVPAAFYDRWIRPGFGRVAGWLYVLPETRTVDAQFHINPGGYHPPSEKPR
ncbi:hypothetical protein [Xylophilus sp. GOD-11R]|uniref:hypothetical protein n=1 Tax=Xylophilus sp. GOD-11R TaxID=3089814 RepID=UPI00298D4A09|nr:hypothetical protein [Xylophilus sp. GOD-11R]WPB58356.1 hypothetical protein R9X41_06850 [Xylophilus sp. GOD-11R]